MKLRNAATTLLAYICYIPYILRIRLHRPASVRLHVGCGKNHFKGWINADIDPRADLVVFMQYGVPFNEGSLDRIYSEHVLEHVPYKIGAAFLKSAHRALRKGGILRVAMPDLDDVIGLYKSGAWKDLDWAKPAKTKAAMINLAFRGWGHQHLYDREELVRAVEEAGFSVYKLCANGQSDHEDLRHLETRANSALIIEAVKT